MEKLEYLQKLNPYLPYDLVVMSGDSYDTDDRLEHKGVMTYGHSSDDNSRSKDFSITEIAFSENNIVTRLGVIKRKVKPVLKPLSDLYKEIDGVVGIVELFKMLCTEDDPYESFHIRLMVDCLEIRDNEALFYFQDGAFRYTVKDELDGFIPNQLTLFTYLFSHHYDIFSLIDKGLAIDLNSISHE